MKSQKFSKISLKFPKLWTIEINAQGKFINQIFIIFLSEY